jgi:tRNA 2-selenouridine synthase
MMPSAIEAIPAALALERLSSHPLIDVRSEGEFAQGSIPGSVNAPILSNEQRHQVGLTYAQEGQAAAIELGLRLVDRERRVTEWLRHVPPGGTSHGTMVTCWRGGLRSRFAAEWLSDNLGAPVHQVEGGYKGMRRTLLPLASEGPELVVVAGCTGARKTELLEAGASVDLEEMACHRGSAFGAHLGKKQPSQASFENRVLLALYRLRARPRVLIEDESQAVGDLAVPPDLLKRIKAAPLVVVEASLEERALHLAQEYAVDPLSAGFEPEFVRERLCAAIERISRRLGGELSARLLKQVHEAFSNQPSEVERHVPWVRALLSEHYDRYYQRALQTQTRPVLFRGSFEECQQWIKTQFV